jgi:signal transduction histidine kinase/ActR/RegA family two-component response regulator
MAVILIIEKRPLGRRRLGAILRTRDHEIVEASDGQQALDVLAQIRPAVVISDILLPTVDGSEFVRRMREIPTGAATPVIFYTATYHEREARALAHRCGVFDVLTNQGAPQEILATVDAALDSSGPLPSAPLGLADFASAPADRADFGSGDPRRGSSTVTAWSDPLAAEKERTKAILEVAEQIAAERDPVALLNTVCTEARHVTLAQHAVLGLLTEEGSTSDRLCTSGLDAETTAGMKPPSVAGALLSAVVRERRPVRTRNPQGRPESLGLPAGHPPVSSLLSVPIASPSRVYGWLSLRNKLGTDEFTEADERVAMTLGTHAGTAYEKARLFDDLQRRVTALEQELGRTTERVREEERTRLSRTLHDQMGQALVGLKIDVQWLASQLASMGKAPTRDTRERVDSILQRLDETIESIRTTAGDLRPAVLDKLGLVAAIEWQAEEFQRRSGIGCRVNSRVAEIDIEPRRATAVFTIVQEALTNVLLHARAARVTVTVRRSVEALTVSVADNGRGIEDGDLANGRSLGLIGMRERAALLGGRLEVRRRRPTGTVVRLTVPLAGARVTRG